MASKKFSVFIQAILFAVALLNLACGRSNKPSSQPSETTETPLTLVADKTTVNVNEEVQFTASGGNPPYTFIVKSGGGVINAQTGSYSAPSQPASVEVRVEDNNDLNAVKTISVVSGTSSYTLTVTPSSTSVAVNSTVTFSATGGTAPYSFSVVSGGGSIQSSTGVFTAPSSTGYAEIKATDSNGATGNYTIAITSAGTSSGDITLPSGLTFNIPTNPAVIRCGSVISQRIDQAYCSVNYSSGASQNLGLVMKMVNVAGSGSCPSVCMCTGESLTKSGWTCKNLPEGKSFQPDIRGCGARIKTFRRGTTDESTCIVNYKGSMKNFNTTMGMTLLTGKKTICDQAKCTCTNDVTYNHTNAGWACSLQ